jgi:hypothetical protein
MVDEDEWRRLLRQERQRDAENRKIVERAMRRGIVAHDLLNWGEIPKILYRVWRSGGLDRLSRTRRQLLIQEVWVHSKNHGVGTRAWVQLFKSVGFLAAWEGEWMDARDSDALDDVEPHLTYLAKRPKESLTAWRGASLRSRGWGMSWTLYREVAARFAQWHADVEDTEGAIFRAVVPPAAMLGCFVTGDEEQEIVVNPQMLRGRIHVDEKIAISEEARAMRVKWRRPPENSNA